MPRVDKSKTPPKPAKEPEADATPQPREGGRMQGRLHLQFGPSASPPGSRLKKR